MPTKRTLAVVAWFLATPAQSFTTPTPPLIRPADPTLWGRRHRRNAHLEMIPSIPSAVANNIYNPPLMGGAHFLLSNFAYLLRRSHIRSMPKRKLLQIRLTREDGVKLPLYITNLLAWQVFVTSVFPLLEPISRAFGYVSFYYFYPNAGGMGIVFEPLSVQSLAMSKRAKSQIRMDWHRFTVNVGAVGRDGYRHPPSVERNLPHIDFPMRRLKHWPWRRKCNVEQSAK